MQTVESRPDDAPLLKPIAWLTRSAQGHLLAWWWCGHHWHRNGWDALGEDGVRCAPHCIPGSERTVSLIQLRVVGDATPAILDAISAGRAPAWLGISDWPQTLIQEEVARQTPSPHRRASRQPARPSPTRRFSVPAQTWRAAAEGIVASCLAGLGAMPDKGTMARLEREAHRLLHQIERDPAAAWRQLVDATGGDLGAGIAAAMG
jgi:hypothetical protein